MFHLVELNRFTNETDRVWFDKAISNVVSQHFGDEYIEAVNIEPYFVDFLHDPPEPIGDDSDDADIDLVYEMVRSPFYSNCLVLFSYQTC